jgi:arylsulfatase A-like enzyme
VSRIAGELPARCRSRAVSGCVGRALAATLAVAALVGCDRTPAVLEPAVHLVDRIALPARTGTRGSCEVGHDLRPALGCPDLMPVGGFKVQASAVDPFPYQAAIPRKFRGAGAIVKAIARGVEGDKWQEAKPAYAPPGTSSIEIGLPHPVRWRGGPALAEELDVRVHALPVAPPRRRYITQAIPIPENAVLTVGVGILAEAVAAGAGPAEFVVVARAGQGARELLRTTVGAEDSRAGWIEHRVELDELAGKEVVFHFVTTARVNPRGFTIPVWGSPEILVRRERDQRRNLILVSLDTVRADHVLTEAYGVSLTPALDALAADGAVFEQAVAPYNSTTASHMTMLTGVYPALHGITYPVGNLAQAIPTLAEILSRGGYQTAAVTENAMITATSGFARGFDSYRENRSVLDAAGDVDATFGDGGKWLEGHADERFFLFLHTYEAHAPYSPKGGALEDLTGPAPEASEGPSDRYAGNRRQYAAEIHYTDRVFGKLVEDLERLDLLDHTVIVVTSDHGEEFGEHGRLGHSKTLYDEVLRVPLVIWAPGIVAAGRRVSEQVSLVDLTPTILDLLGVAAPPGMHGVSLRGLLSDDTPAATPPRDEVRFAEGLDDETPRRRFIVARTRDHKWIQMADEDAPREIYDLQSDPGEKQPRDDPALRERGRELIARYRALEPAPLPSPSPAGPLDPATQRKLEALGYVD